MAFIDPDDAFNCLDIEFLEFRELNADTSFTGQVSGGSYCLKKSDMAVDL